LKAAIDEIKLVTEETKKAQRLSRLVAILAKETALGEIFGVS